MNSAVPDPGDDQMLLTDEIYKVPLAQLNGGLPMSQAAAGFIPSTADDTAELDQNFQQQDEDAPSQLTSTVAEGLQNIEQRRQQLHAMMEELAQVGLHFLDQQRQQFLRIIESFKQDVDSFCREEVMKGQEMSSNTINANERLARAQLLVQSLGGAVCQPGAVGLMS